MRFTSTLAAVACVLSAAPSALATITITGPSANSYWVQDISNTITWEFTQGDPNPITITVTNPNSTFLNGAFPIAERVDLSNKTFTVTNVTLNVHPGYIVNFVNGSNITQVYAQSGVFDVRAPGTTPATPSGSSPSATGTSPAGNSSATASGSSSTSSNKPNASLRSFDGSLTTLIPMLGMSALMCVVGALAML